MEGQIITPRRVPPCKSMGSHCRSLAVTLRVGSLEEGPASLDHEGTWLLGHTQRITFSELWQDDEDLYVDAVLHVPCKFLRRDGTLATCRAHAFMGRLPREYSRMEQPRRLGGDRFLVVHRGQTQVRRLPFPRLSLPVLESQAGPNPCAVAPCATADHKRGAACCRDLQVEIMCTKEERRLEALVFSRQSPYLCKVEREGDFSIGAEMISACDYIGEDRVGCTLHGRLRADGRPAKPDLCSEWPPKNKGLHPGCVFGPKRRRKPAKA